MSSIKMKKFGMIKGVLDNIRQSVNTPSPPGLSTPGPVRLEQELLESLTTEQFCVGQTLKHGFPHKPTAVAFDPIQKVLAIATKSGVVRCVGRPGIDVEFRHEADVAVLQLVFRYNTGQLLTRCADNSINLWSFREKRPELLETLQFTKESVTAMALEFLDKWLYLGTERGNFHILNLETFQLSGYVAPWNKFIDPLMKSHPGIMNIITANPVDPSKLLVGFEFGLVCLWDLQAKKGEQRYNYSQKLLSICWHMEGRQFVCSYADGALVTWNVKPAQHGKPCSVQFPHAKKNPETGKPEPCDPIEKVLWRVNRSNYESYFVFSGGLPHDVTGTTPSITVMQGKSTTQLEMENCVLDFLLVTDSPYPTDYQDPQAIIVMLKNDLVGIDCSKAPKFPCFKNPYAMDFNESAVTCCQYVVECPADLIMDLYRIGSRSEKKDGFSTGEWPISGGNDSGTESCSYTELIVTGHADGSLRFWDSSSTSMQALYKFKTNKYFERNKKAAADPVQQRKSPGFEDDPYAITVIELDPDTRELAVAGASGQVLFFRLRKAETTTETKSMEIPIVYEVSASQQAAAAARKEAAAASDGSPSNSGPQHFEFPTPKPLLNVASQSSSYTDPVDGFNFDKVQYEYYSPLKLRAGSQRKAPGYHLELMCLTPWVNNEPPTAISCVALSSPFGLLAYANGSGLVIVDVVQFVCLLNMGTADLYGALDPFQRMPKSPKPLDGTGGLEIVRVDLGSYSQMPSGSDTPSAAAAATDLAATASLSSNATTAKDSIALPSRAGERVKSPDCRRLQKAGSSAEDPSSGGGGMSKSLSSSVNSLDQMITSEGVTHLNFVDSFPSKTDFSLGACLYVGTTLGSVIAIIINLPEKGDARLTEPVVVSPSGTLYRLKGSGSILTTSFLDCSSGSGLCARPGEPAVNVLVPAKIPTSRNGQLTTQGSQEKDEKSPPGSSSSGGQGDQQIAVVCSDKAAFVYALPSQRQMYCQTINESANVVVAEVINFGGTRYTPCLVAYTSDGYVKAYSLPSLRPLLDRYLPAPERRKDGLMTKTLCLSHYGHGMYFSNYTELQKFSISTDFLRQLPEMQGTVFTEAIPMPEPPKQGILSGMTSLFSAKPKPLDREELFGENAGKIGSSVAKNIPGARGQATAMQGVQGRGVSATSEVGKAHAGFVERGQKISELEDRTEAMHNEAKQYAQNAHNVMLSMKNKKWYQL